MRLEKIIVFFSRNILVKGAEPRAYVSIRKPVLLLRGHRSEGAQSWIDPSPFLLGGEYLSKTPPEKLYCWQTGWPNGREKEHGGGIAGLSVPGGKTWNGIGDPVRYLL